jgi:hypothetical protein
MQPLDRQTVDDKDDAEDCSVLEFSQYDDKMELSD